MFLCSTQRSDLIWLSSVCLEWHEETELCLQDASRKLPGKSCCKQRVLTPNLVHRSLLIKKIYFWQVPKTFNSTVALQGAFLKRLGDVVLLYLVCLSFFMSFQTDWWWSDLSVEHKNITGLLQLMAKWMSGNENWYFLLTHYSKRWK